MKQWRKLAVSSFLSIWLFLPLSSRQHSEISGLVTCDFFVKLNTILYLCLISRCIHEWYVVNQSHRLTNKYTPKRTSFFFISLCNFVWMEMIWCDFMHSAESSWKKKTPQLRLLKVILMAIMLVKSARCFDRNINQLRLRIRIVVFFSSFFICDYIWQIYINFYRILQSFVLRRKRRCKK